MTDETRITIVGGDGELVTDADAERMRQAGQIANVAASARVVGDYLTRCAANTRRRQSFELTTFADFLDAAGSLGGGIRRFARDVGDFPASDPDPAAWSGVTWGIVAAFVCWLLDTGYAVGTVNVHLATVRRYAQLAHTAGVIDHDEHSRICTVKGYTYEQGVNLDGQRETTRIGDKKDEPTRISNEHADRLKDQPDTPQGRRDALLMCLLIDHGLRVSEVAALTVDAFDLTAGTMTFYRPKVKLTQTHDLSADTRQALGGWIDSGDCPVMQDMPVLRASRKGGALTDAGISNRAIAKRVKVLGEAVGIDGLSPHDCRHYWATYWAQRVDRLPRGVLSLQEAGGWNSLAMPRRYVEAARIANEGMGG
jgi:integrase